MHRLLPQESENLVERASQILWDYCLKNKIHYVVTGSSGGLDSAVTLGLAQRACFKARQVGFPLTSVGLILPIHSKPEAEILGRQAIKKFGAEEIKINLSEVFDFVLENNVSQTNNQVLQLLKKTGGQQALEEFAWSSNVAQGNIRARLRMALGTYHIARLLKGMVLSTDNLSELWMAFWTICGDVGDFAMIQNVLKGLELYDLAFYLDVPIGIIEAKPDDGLGIAGGDEDQIGAPYEIVDMIMIRLIQAGFDSDGSYDQINNLPAVGYNPELVKKIAGRCLTGFYKRQGTVVLSREELGLKPIQMIEI